jgi:hypothetical protein
MITVVWEATPHNFVDRCQCFGGTCSIHFQGRYSETGGVFFSRTLATIYHTAWCHISDNHNHYIHYSEHFKFQVPEEAARHTVAQFVDALCYKSEGGGISSPDEVDFFNLPNPH